MSPGLRLAWFLREQLPPRNNVQERRDVAGTRSTHFTMDHQDLLVYQRVHSKERIIAMLYWMASQVSFSYDVAVACASVNSQATPDFQHHAMPKLAQP